MNKKLKLGLKVAGGTLAWIPASVLVLAQIDVPTSLNSKAPLNKRYFRDLIELNPNLKTTPVTNIAMLASHDALSDSINMMSGSDIYSPNNTQLAQIAKYVGQGAMVRLSRAQSDDIYTQLNAGVRYIDARITHINGKYYTHHTMISNTLEHYLMQILKWLDENEGEFVFFHIYYFNYCHDTSDPAYESQEDAWANLKTYIESVKYNGKSLFDYDLTLKNDPDNCQFENLTWSNITNDGQQAGAVIFFSSDDPAEAQFDTWCYKHIYYDDEGGRTYKKHIYNPCAVRMDSNIIVDKINNTWIPEVKDKYSSSKYLKYLQTQTTPNVSDAAQIVTAWSLIQKAHDHNDFILNHAGLNFSDPTADDCIFKYMPIYMCDYCTCNDNGFCQKLIDYMIAFNKTL